MVTSKFRLSLIFFISLIPYVQSLGYGFTFDDQTRIVESVYDFSLGGIYSIFTKPSWPGDLYRPLTDLTFLLNKAAFGMHAMPFHLVNILLHGLAAILVFKLFYRVAGEEAAFYAAILFGLHPVNTEVVSNISYRGEILGLIFGLTGSLYYLSGRLFSSSLLLLLGALSKESALTFLAIAPFTAFILERKIVVRKFAVPATVAALYLILRYNALDALLSVNQSTGFIDNFLLYTDPASRIVTSILILSKYIFSFIMPYGLAADYSYAQISELNTWSNADLLFSSVVMIVALTLVFIFLLKVLRGKISNAGLYYGICFFFLAFILTANVLFPIGTVFGLRLMYAPSAGLCLAFVTLILNCKLKPLLSITSLILAGLSAYQSSFWVNNETLWLRQQEVSPKSVRVWHSTAARLMQSGALDTAVAAEKKALDILPNFQPGLMLLQRVYFMQAKYAESREVIERIGLIEKSPHYYDGLGWLDLKEGKLDSAEANFNQALSLYPQIKTAPLGLFAVAVMRKQSELAFDISKNFSETQKRDMRYKEYEKILLSSLK